MPYDGSGNFNRYRGGATTWQADAAASVKIRADYHDQNDNDLAQGLSLALTRDGQSSPTADISWNGKRLTNLTNPSNPQDAATKDYVDKLKAFATGITITGSDANGRITYSGTGEIGSSYTGGTAPGMFAGVDTTTDQWIWVDSADPADAAALNVMSLTRTGTLTQTYKADGALGGPVHELYRDKVSISGGVNGDALGVIHFTGKDSSNAKTNFAQIYGYIEKADNNLEGGGLLFNRMVDGVMTQGMAINKDGVVVHGIAKLEGGTWFNAAGSWNFQTGSDQHLYQYYTTGYFWRFNTTGTANGDLQYWSNNVFVFNIDVTGIVNCFKGVTFDDGATYRASYDATYKYFVYETGHYWQYVKADGTLYYNQGGVSPMRIIGGYVELTTMAHAPAGMYFNLSKSHYLGSSGDNEVHQFATSYYHVLNTVSGELHWVANYTTVATNFANGNYSIAGATASKQTAGQWVANSDIRLKNVHGDYTPGLAEVCAVQPVTYSYKTDPDTVHTGFIAQDIEGVFPDTVSLTRGEIDGETVDDLRQFDPTNLLYAAMNAIKELKGLLDEANARIAALEAQ